MDLNYSLLLTLFKLDRCVLDIGHPQKAQLFSEGTLLDFGLIFERWPLLVPVRALL